MLSVSNKANLIVFLLLMTNNSRAIGESDSILIVDDY